MEVKDLNAGRQVQNVSFNVKSGEVLGLYGLIGSGRTESVRAVYADPIDTGRLRNMTETPGLGIEFNHVGDTFD